VFRRAREYLEDLVDWTDAPLLHCLHITFFHQLTFDTPQLAHFVSRLPALNVLNQAQARGFQPHWLDDIDNGRASVLQYNKMNVTVMMSRKCHE
jgi:hypothetical protein